MTLENIQPIIGGWGGGGGFMVILLMILCQIVTLMLRLFLVMLHDMLILCLRIVFCIEHLGTLKYFIYFTLLT